MKKIRCAVAAVLVAATATAYAAPAKGGGELLVIGPVEALDAADGIATVLGQRVRTTSHLAVGEAVAVFGAMHPDGSIVASSIQARGLYVAGASPIFISGMVQRSEPSIGRVVINGVVVDMTPAMSSGALSAEVGSKMAISGTQPVARGLVLLNGISGTGSSVSGISGTGLNGISGTGASVSGISGTGLNGISGTGASVSGISGTGLNGISGTGHSVDGISGT
ncbi:MAG TPA: hypothetical protein VH109_10065, partial [Steroidobacteraceae bacterium]|nr:hypothetical protein [Steroidobacteraceae bacterium]